MCSKSFLGTPMEVIYGGRGPWCFETAPINITRRHTVLYELPVTLKAPPKPHASSEIFNWDEDHVRMPHSPQNLFPVEQDGEKCLRKRWAIIETALLQPIHTSHELEAVINSYNTKLPKFLALHNFFESVLEEEETIVFFNNLLPKIIALALRLPEIVPGSLPLLKRNLNRSISLSQLQIASLLANAFLCTFPWRKETATYYPGCNFVRLFAAHLRPKREQAVAEKLKCICHYFRRITDQEPFGVVTFERKFIHKSQLPDWNRFDKNLDNTRLHVTSKGVIEDDGLGLLQVDFANKNVGGGVLGFGCVQEEIRYIICPELIISRLFTEQLGPTEALVVTGVERFSKYGGYGDTFTWEGNFNDTTPYDAWGRRRTTVVAIDALRFGKPLEQYNTTSMLRELNKAYAGFHSDLAQRLPPVATGNWGCGAFRGDARLKALLQLMACSATKRDLVYYTFRDNELQEDLYNIHSFITSRQIKISQLWKYLVGFSQLKTIAPEHLYPYIQQAHLDGKTKPTLETFFGRTNVKIDESIPSTSACPIENDVIIDVEYDTPMSQDIIESSQNTEVMEVIESSQTEYNSCYTNVKEQNEIKELFDVIHGDTKEKTCQSVSSKMFNNIIEISSSSESSNQSSRETSENTPKRIKITDYFIKIDKG